MCVVYVLCVEVCVVVCVMIVCCGVCDEVFMC